MIGMAVPRSTKPKDKTVNRSARLVASSAKATRRQRQPSRIQVNNGAKQEETSSSRRLLPDLAAAGW